MAKEIKYINGTTLNQEATVYTVPAGKIAKVRILEFSQYNYSINNPSYFYVGSYNQPSNLFMCPYNSPSIDVATGTGSLDMENTYGSFGWESYATMDGTLSSNARQIIMGPNETLKYYYENSSYRVSNWSFMIIEEDLGVQ